MSAEAPILEHSVAYQCRGTFRAFETAMQRWLRDENLLLAHFEVLRVLWVEDGMAQSVLAERAFITESSMAQVISQMAAEQLVERRIDTDDRRKRMIYLLPKAKRLEKRVIAMAGGLYAAAIDGLSQEQIETYNSVSVLLRDNIARGYERRWGDAAGES